MANKKLKIRLGVCEIQGPSGTILVPTIDAIAFDCHKTAQMWGNQLKLAVYLDHENDEVMAKPFIALEPSDREARTIHVFYDNPFQSQEFVFLDASPFTGADIEIASPPVSEFTSYEDIVGTSTLATEEEPVATGDDDDDDEEAVEDEEDEDAEFVDDEDDDAGEFTDGDEFEDVEEEEVGV